MHSRIIQLSDKPLTKDEWLDPDVAISDSTISYVADYADSCTEEEREEAITALADLLDGIATVDAEKGAVTVTDNLAAAQKAVNEWHGQAARDILKQLETEKCPDPLQSCFSLEKYRGSSFLFYIGYGRLSSAFIRDLACGHYCKTLHIGAVLDYHY